MRGLRRFATVLLFASGLAHAERANAQTAAPIELRWSALEGCPRADTVLARARKIAGVTRATQNTLQADASITQASEGLFRLRLEIHYGNLAAVRNIEGKSCKDLAGATAVALALLLSSGEPLSDRELADDLAGSPPTTTGAAPSGGNGAPDKPAVVETKATTSSSQPSPATVPSSSSGAPRRWRLLLDEPLGSVSVGPMSQVNGGLGIGAGLAFDRFRFLAEGKLWASQHDTIRHGSETYDVELNRFTVSARGCRVVLGDLFELAPCALMSVHHLSVRGGGLNFAPTETGTATWAAVGIGARARLLITPWLGVVAAADGELQLSRPEFSASPPSESLVPASDLVERVAPAAATISISVEWIL